VICEIMNEDGSMARLPDLERFAARHALKICTIADLIEYRLRNDSLVHRVAEAVVPTRAGGPFTAYVYKTDVDEGEHLVLVRGEITPDEPILVRAHAEYLPGDVFGSLERDTSALLAKSMAMIAKAGRGVILYLRREAQGEELTDRTRPRETARRPSTESRNRATDFREYGIGAQILRDVGLGKIRLITNYPRRMVSLPGYGLEIVDCVPIKVAPPRAARRPAVAVNAARRAHSKSAATRSTSKA
jgi:3,4-dihydroxy 2-butanone 4-phosphate synthase/GTP cyclohydrolase II